MTMQERYAAATRVLGEHDANGWMALTGCAYPTAGKLAAGEASEMVLRHLELLAGLRSVHGAKVEVPAPAPRTIAPDARKALDKLAAYLQLTEDQIVEALLLEVAYLSRAGLGVAVTAQRIKNARRAAKVSL